MKHDTKYWLVMVARYKEHPWWIVCVIVYLVTEYFEKLYIQCNGDTQACIINFKVSSVIWGMGLFHQLAVVCATVTVEI